MYWFDFFSFHFFIVIFVPSCSFRHDSFSTKQNKKNYWKIFIQTECFLVEIMMISENGRLPARDLHKFCLFVWFWFVLFFFLNYLSLFFVWEILLQKNLILLTNSAIFIHFKCIACWLLFFSNNSAILTTNHSHLNIGPRQRKQSLSINNQDSITAAVFFSIFFRVVFVVVCRLFQMMVVWLNYSGPFTDKKR